MAHKYLTVGEYGDYFQGDMMLREEQFNIISAKTSLRNGLLAATYRWPNKTVPYKLNTQHTDQQNSLFEFALKGIESESCVNFVRRTNETDYVEITVIKIFV